MHLIFYRKKVLPRLDLLNFISHGIAKVAVEEEEDENLNYDNGDEEETRQNRSENDPLKLYTNNLSKQAEENLSLIHI